MDKVKIIGIIENILFTAGEAVAIKDLAMALDMDKYVLQQLLEEEMKAREQTAGLMIRRFEDSVQLCTRPEYADLIVEMLGEKNEAELSRATMETLSIIAYRQPVTKDEVEKIRGVNSSYTINALLEKDLIYVAGRKDALGRPKLYATTQAFLRYFDIASIEELPALPGEDEELPLFGEQDTWPEEEQA